MFQPPAGGFKSDSASHFLVPSPEDFIPTPAQLASSPTAIIRAATAFYALWFDAYAHNPIIEKCNPVGARVAAAWSEAIKLCATAPTTPEFGFKNIAMDGKTVDVRLTAIERPFSTLLHFERDTSAVQPQVLIVTPLSGHFATLLRGTVKAFLPHHDTHVLAWNDIRHIPESEGVFDLNTYHAEIASSLRELAKGGRPVHVVAVCQPCPATLAVASRLAEDSDPATPRSLTLIAGPVDTRINPTGVNEAANSRSIDWMRQKLIHRVDARFAGADREVLPELLQLTAFMKPNLEKHMTSMRDMITARINGDDQKADRIHTFYDEYYAVMPLSADYLLRTVRDVFQEHRLPKGVWEHVDETGATRIANLAALGPRTPLLTVEGEKDDITGLGQTFATHALTPNIPYDLKHHIEIRGAGHYGAFGGSGKEPGKQFAAEFPNIEAFIAMADRRATSNLGLH